MNDKETITVWVTKYALTQGIYKVRATIDHKLNSNIISYWGDTVTGPTYAGSKEWHRTPQDALAKAQEMRAAKISCLKKAILKLEQLMLEVPI